MVDNLKRQAQIKSLKKYYATTIITMLSFSFIYVTQGIFGKLSIPVLIVLAIGGVSNIIAIVYFMDEISKLEKESEEVTNRKLKYSMILTLTSIAGLITILFLIWLFN